MGRLRRRLAAWLDPTLGAVDPTAEQTRELPLVPVRPPGDDVWKSIAEQFASRVLASSGRMSTDLAEAEALEQDPDRLHRLYRLDHATTGIRRLAETLHVVAGVRVDDPGRQVTTLLDVVRAAAAAVAEYPRVHIGRVPELAIVEAAADDVIRVLTELFDNAARFSPPQSRVTVTTQLIEQGHVLVRVEDEGAGIDPAQLTRYNAALAGDQPLTFDPDNPATRLGLLVVQRLAVALGLRVSLVPRAHGGTTTTVLVPPALLCEPPASAAPPAVDSGQSSVAGAVVGPRSGAVLPDEPVSPEGPVRRVRPVTSIVPTLPRRPATRVPQPVRHGQPVPLRRVPLPRNPTAVPLSTVESSFSDEIGAFADGVAHAKAAQEPQTTFETGGTGL